MFHLLLRKLPKAAHGRSNSAIVGGAQSVCSTCYSFAAAIAAPDTDCSTTERKLSAERAEVACVLGNLELLSALTGVGTITCTIASHDAHLSRTLRHPLLETKRKKG